MNVRTGSGQRRIEAARPLLVEIMGPAGSGKTTLAMSVVGRDATVRNGIALDKRMYVAAVAPVIGRVATRWAVHHRGDRWLDRRERRSIARLAAWAAAIRSGRTGGSGAIVFDHGPLYRLARLRAFGPSVTRSAGFRAWWNDMYRFWLDSLDVVIELDAPDDVLLQRTEQRGHWFLAAGHERSERVRFLQEYRAILADVLQDAPSTLAVRNFDTDRMLADDLSEAAMTLLYSLASARGGWGDPPS